MLKKMANETVLAILFVPILQWAGSKWPLVLDSLDYAYVLMSQAF